MPTMTYENLQEIFDEHPDQIRITLPLWIWGFLLDSNFIASRTRLTATLSKADDIQEARDAIEFFQVGDEVASGILGRARAQNPDTFDAAMLRSDARHSIDIEAPLDLFSDFLSPILAYVALSPRPHTPLDLSRGPLAVDGAVRADAIWAALDLATPQLPHQIVDVLANLSGANLRGGSR